MNHTINPVKRHRERCREVRADMGDYLDGDLGSSAGAAVRRHVRWCPSCRRMLRNLTRTVSGLRALDAPPVGADQTEAGLSGVGLLVIAVKRGIQL